jgi:hypothetical protein
LSNSSGRPNEPDPLPSLTCVAFLPSFPCPSFYFVCTFLFPFINFNLFWQKLYTLKYLCIFYRYLICTYRKRVLMVVSCIKHDDILSSKWLIFFVIHSHWSHVTYSIKKYVTYMKISIANTLIEPWILII